MAADGAALAEVRAGITFGVDAPEAVVDVSSEGVVPLRNIPDVIGLVGREGAAERRVLPGPGTFAVYESWFRIVGEWTRTFTMCFNYRYGRGAGIVSFHSGVIGSQSTMAPGGPQPHGVASTGTGRDAFGS